MKLAILIICSYLLGSVPFGLLIAKTHGKNLRKIGSGNIGATNLSRALGKKWAYVCFALDASKGFVPMLIVTRFISSPPTITQLLGWLSVGATAVLGHIFPLYAGFKGGKGVATSFGVALGLWPYYTVCAAAAFMIWAAVVLIWRYISLGSIVASISFPVTLILAIFLIKNWSFTRLWPLVITAIIIPLAVILRHRENIKRLMAGTESKIFADKKIQAGKLIR